MSAELSLSFPDTNRVIVSFGDERTSTLPFSNPITVQDRQDLRWYLELYGARSLGDPDDKEAARIASRLPVLGKALFDAVFSDGAAQRIFNAFQDATDGARLLTISAQHPAILDLPWELLHDSGAGGVFLFFEEPRISIRRGVAGATGGRPPFPVESKDRLHLLFVISRPEHAGFLDPRADASAVLDALEKHAPGRFTWEVLRPPTLDALVGRLEDQNRPPADILHFDGHGVFDRDGGLPERVSEIPRLLQQFLSGHLMKDRKANVAAASPAHTGYLLFETADGQPDFVSAQKLGQNLNRHRVPLIILSACQSAALGDNDEPFGSVAARLIAAGIPAVLAMTHSVLVPTTRALFGELYQHLARGRGIGEALDNARRHLFNNPKRYEVARYDAQGGMRRQWLELQDWFVPALYQAGADVPLVRKSEGRGQRLEVEVAAPRTNLPDAPEEGFFGRQQELWDIERWFAGRTRRITVTGFGGQGKTALALEAARWLTRTRMFRAAVFVDYSRVQGRDALAVAVSHVGSVLEQSLVDAEAAGEALRQTPTLVVLDNLEAVDAEPRRELLDAAKGWSEAGQSRVLITTRTPDFGHPDYRTEGTLVHRRMLLEGLGSRQAPDDALKWFVELWKLPPRPEVSETPRPQALVELFDKVRFHPLSIRVLAQQSKTRRPAELGERLEQLLAGRADLAAAATSTEAMLPELVASLKLSLDRLDDAARQVLPRLGVFQSGAFEDDLLAITGLAASGEHENVWPALRRQLEATALLQAETVPGVRPPFLRFHPTLAPMLWEQLGQDERAQLTTAHRQRYAALATYLYHRDSQNPQQARAIARRELPNLLRAVHAAFAAHDPDAGGFATSVTRFLTAFGLKRDAEALAARAQAASGEEGSRSWYLAQSDRGEQLLAGGRVAEAAQVFEAILARLGDGPSHQRATTLGRLGRCFEAGGRPDLAAARYREAIRVTEMLEQDDAVRRLRAALYTDLADTLRQMGEYGEARKQYEAGLATAQELKDLRGQGVSMGQLGTLAMLEGHLAEAQERYRAALALFQQLGEPAMESVFWHQLGRVFQEARQWEEAERHYREAARIREQHGMIAGPNGAATTWNQLAVVNQLAGKPEAAEMWYRKALERFPAAGDETSKSACLNNLAALLRSQPGRLAEARQLAEEALAIMRTLDPGAAKIWTTYGILAEIADQEAESIPDVRRNAELRAQARDYRRLARQAKRSFPGTRYELQKHVPLILAAVRATQQPDLRGQMETLLTGGEGRGWKNLVAAIRRILAGERDADGLCDDLDLEDSMIVEAILAALTDPSTLADLLPEQSPGA